jgi:ComF family protein
MADRLVSNHSARNWFTQARDAIISIFFPADCRICEHFLAHVSRIPICRDCLSSFRTLPAGVCEICGHPIENPPTVAGAAAAYGTDKLRMVCPRCRTRTYSFDCARSYAFYDAALVRAILMLKFDRIEPLGVWFAHRLEEVVKLDLRLRADVVVPVPLHPRRQKERGYNQADLIAKPLAKQLGLPYRSSLLVRTRPRPEKHLLTLRERWESVRGAFATSRSSRVDNLRVLLVDDVLTTGATLDACAKVLREAGAKSVIGLTVARAPQLRAESSGTSRPEDA